MRQQSLEFACGLDIATTGGLIDALLQLKDIALDLLPVDCLPSIGCGVTVVIAYALLLEPLSSR
jgi:hypothetical protein